MPTIAELENKLHWRERAIALMLEIDRIRDTFEEEKELTASVLGRLVEAVGAELGLLFQREEAEGALRLRALVDRAKLYAGPLIAMLRDLAERASRRESGEIVHADLPLPGRPPAALLAFPLRGLSNNGALLVSNLERPFDRDQVEMARLAVSQIDSAIDHARTLNALRMQKKETEIIYRIDRIRDEKENLQEMLDAVLPEVCKATESQTAFVMLYSSSGEELELRAATDYDLLALGDPSNPIHALAGEAVQSAKLVTRSFESGQVRSIMGQPLILHDRLIGVVGVINRLGRDDFTTADRRILGAIGSQIDTAIFEGLEIQRIRTAFGQCVGPEVMKRLLIAADEDLLSGDRLVITSLFSDIRGFTRMAGHLEPELLRVVINDHLSAMTELVLAHEGTLDKYIGDSVMCFFNAPERQPDHALRAVRLALEMQRAHARVIERWQGRLQLPPIGIGISTGETIVGNFGSVKRLEYTVIGNDVNLAARLCGAAEGGQVLISEGTLALVMDSVEAELMPPQWLKGIGDEVPCWSVTAVRDEGGRP